MDLRYFILMLAVFMLVSCEKEDEPPSDQGDVTVSSRFYGTNVYYVLGYSFELDKAVSSMPGNNEVADIIPQQIITPQSEVIGVQFSSPGEGNNGFYQNGEFSSAQEAMDFYNSYTEAVDGPFISMSDTIRENQVYTFLTHKAHYVKFVVKDVRIINSDAYSDYVEVDLEYFIQRDGTKNLQQ